jgi:hypothetical protein
MVTTMFLGMERTAQFEVDAEARTRTGASTNIDKNLTRRG